MKTHHRHLLALSGVTALLWGAMSASFAADSHEHILRIGKVFTSSNASSNELLVYEQQDGGGLSLVTQVATGGQGTGSGLGSQGAVTLSRDGHYLFVVNASSNTVSTFSLDSAEPRLESVVSSGGLEPISVTESNGLVYVLNAQGSAGVRGFRNDHGQLQPVTGAQGALSLPTGAGPAEVSFSSDGEALFVTEKTTSKLTSYRVKADGTLSAPVITASSGMTPFGFAVDGHDHLIVSEAAGGAVNGGSVSSYKVTDAAVARPILVSASVPTTQTAACWVALSPNGHYAYISNAGSGTVSSYRVSPRTGQITLLQAVAGNIGAGSHPIDAAVSPDGEHLLVLASGSLTVSNFEIHHDGSLGVGTVTSGLPSGAVGLAVN